MAFREVRDPDTRELVIRYDPETDRIEYKNRNGRPREMDLAPYRATKSMAPVVTPRRPVLD